MTSKESRECYVYIMLPGTTKFVTAAKFVLSKDPSGIALGQLVYGAKYLNRDDAVPIDPIELKLQSGTFQTHSLKGVFGALRDAGPDFWGRRIVEKRSGVPELGELDYLLNSPDDRAGALCFGLGKTPPAPCRKFNQTIALPRLLELADSIIEDDPLLESSDIEQVEDLMLVGTSMGGARPKTVVEDEEGLWLAKFNRPDDRWNYSRVEHSMLVLAKDCGLQVAKSKVEKIGERDVLLVKRFDRKKTNRGYERARMVSALTILRAEESGTDRGRWSYILLAEELRKVCAKPAEACTELFRRMCFNALISNTDDHPRNHAIIAFGQDWSLSPAYDLTPSPLVSVEQRDLAMICGDRGRIANAKNLTSQCRRFHLEPNEVDGIISSMETFVHENWYKTALAQGVTESDCEKISRAFVYPGFRTS